MTAGHPRPPAIPGVQARQLIATTRNSTVWLGDQEVLERQVIVKVLRALSPEAIRLFEQERRVLGRLSQHPRIVTIYQSGTEAGLPYLILQFADGGSLRDQMAAHPIVGAERRTIVQATGEALAILHQAGFVHGDVKPDNVLIDSQAGPLLADFGLARLVQRDGSTGYTLAYAAPEVLRGEPTTPAADMYSFGVVIFEMLTGRLPFDPSEDESVLGFARRVATEPLPSWPESTDAADLEHLAQLLLAKSPTDRPAAATIFDLAGPQAVTVRASPSGRADGVKVTRWRKAAAALAVGAVAFTIATVALLASRSERGAMEPAVATDTVLSAEEGPSTTRSETATTGESGDESAPPPPPSDQTTSRRPFVPQPLASVIKYDDGLWIGTAAYDGIEVALVNIRGLTPFAPRLVDDNAWISARGVGLTDGVVAALDASTGELSVLFDGVDPTDRPLAEGRTALVPLAGGLLDEGLPETNGGFVVVSRVPSSIGLGWRPIEAPASLVYLDPADDEWSRPVVAYVQEAGPFATDFDLLNLDETGDSIAELVFPNGVDARGEPGAILALGGPGGDYAYYAERPPVAFEGALVTRWPGPGQGPPVPWPVDSATSGTVQDVLHLAPDETVWLTSRERIVTRFDPGSNSVTGTATAGPCPVVDELVGCEFLVDDASHGLLAHGAFWLGNPVDGSLYRIDLESMEVTDKIEIGGTPGTPAATDVAVWVTDLDSATVFRIDPEVRSITHRIGLPCVESPADPDNIVLTDCEPWLGGLDWRHRPIGSSDEVWVPWHGMLYRLSEPSPHDVDLEE